MKEMENLTQQEFLQVAKNALHMTWDELADSAGIAPRALKTYRMPPTSKDFRELNNLARNAIVRLLGDNRKKVIKIA